MMKFLRKEGVMKTLLWIVAIVIVLSFGIFSNAYLLEERSSKLKYAGRIFGEKVQIKDFISQMEFLDAYYMITVPGYEKIRPQVGIEARTWERLILLHEVKKERITVKDDEVVSTIKNFFSANGSFNAEWYRSTLQRLQISASKFEEGVRQTLAIEKLFELKTLGLSVNDEELLAAYTQKNEQAQVSYASFATSSYLTTIAADEIAVKSFFIDHKAEFAQPPSIQVHYLTFSSPEEGSQEPYDRALDASNRLFQGESIYSIAQSMNMKVAETGFFNTNNVDIALGWPLSTIERLYDMQPLEGAEFVPMKSGGYQILQVKAKRDAYLPAFEEVKQEATQAWQETQAKALAKKDAEAKRSEIISALEQNSGQTFEQAASNLGIALQETPVFKRNDYLPALGIATELQEAAFQVKDGSVSDVIETPIGYAFFKVVQRIAIDMTAFEKERESMRMEVLRKKQTTAFNSYFTDVLSKANLEDKISEWMKK